MTKSTVSGSDVDRIRDSIARAHELAAAQFRDTFVPGQTLPTAHLEILAAALLEYAEGVRALGAIHYQIDDDTIAPFVVPDQPLFRYFDVEKNPTAVFEYWLIVSEIIGSTSWRMTTLIATPEEYDISLRRMRSPQIVRALVVSFLPSVEMRDDGSAFLEATVYSRAGEERIERRLLLLDPFNEFHFHGRELIAEGRGGVRT
ncbi:MAG TPA: hypothetical protein VKL19_13090 [Thermoanaerobaculia bacterium]|nr:hypothetical protein [Thermoanaerobaculia bacterium]